MERSWRIKISQAFPGGELQQQNFDRQFHCFLEAGLRKPVISFRDFRHHQKSKTGEHVVCMAEAGDSPYPTIFGTTDRFPRSSNHVPEGAVLTFYLHASSKIRC
jgi:hypothetical protein